MADGTQVTSEQAIKIWTTFMGEPPSSAEYNLFAPFLRHFGSNNHLIVLAMYLIHLTHRDARSIEFEILDKGPSVLQQVRELTDEFDKTRQIVQKINLATMNLGVEYTHLKYQLKDIKTRDRTKWERIYNFVVRQHHPVKLIASIVLGMLFANFAGLILIAYVLGLTPPLIATGNTITVEADTSARPMQSWKQPNRNLTPSELAAEDKEWETR